jgi:hypothetical protein
MVKETNRNIVTQLLNIFNTLSVTEVVIDTLNKVNLDNLENLAKNIMLKEDKDNKSVKKIYEKLKLRAQRYVANGFEPCDVLVPNVKRKTLVTEIIPKMRKDNKVPMSEINSIGNRTELLEYVIENGLKIDRVYYLGQVIKSCARYCHCAFKLKLDGTAFATDDDTQKYCEKYIQKRIGDAVEKSIAEKNAIVRIHSPKFNKFTFIEYMAEANGSLMEYTDASVKNDTNNAILYPLPKDVPESEEYYENAYNNLLRSIDYKQLFLDIQVYMRRKINYFNNVYARRSATFDIRDLSLLDYKQKYDKLIELKLHFYAAKAKTLNIK